MKFRVIRNALIIAVSLLLVLTLFGCSKQNKKQDTKSEGEKPPESLTKLEKNIDSIIDSLDKEGRIEEPEQKQQTDQKSKESQNMQSQGQSQQGQQGQGQGQQGQGQQGQQGQGQQQGSGQQSSGQQQGQQQQAQQANPWDQADKTIKEMHRTWNEFQPQAAKSGVSQETISGFGDTLNALTNDIAVKNLMNTLNDANALYKFMPEFMSHYKDKTVDLKRLKYFVRDVMYKSRFDKWAEADSSAASAKALLPNIRTQAKDENKQKYQSVEFAVNDLEKVVKERQKSLVQIKGNVVLSVLKNLEKEGQQDSGGGSKSK